MKTHNARKLCLILLVVAHALPACAQQEEAIRSQLATLIASPVSDGLSVKRGNNSFSFEYGSWMGSATLDGKILACMDTSTRDREEDPNGPPFATDDSDVISRAKQMAAQRNLHSEWTCTVRRLKGGGSSVFPSTCVVRFEEDKEVAGRRPKGGNHFTLALRKKDGRLVSYDTAPLRAYLDTDILGEAEIKARVLRNFPELGFGPQAKATLTWFRRPDTDFLPAYWVSEGGVSVAVRADDGSFLQAAAVKGAGAKAKSVVDLNKRQEQRTQLPAPLTIGVVVLGSAVLWRVLTRPRS